MSVVHESVRCMLCMSVFCICVYSACVCFCLFVCSEVLLPSHHY